MTFPVQHRAQVHSTNPIERLADLPTTIQLHDLRQTSASHAIMSGETLHMTGKLLGHKSSDSTEHYVPLDGSYLAKVADKVARKVDELLSG